MRVAVTSLVFLLFVFTCDTEACSRSGSGNSHGRDSFSYDMNKRRLTNLYNSRVTKLQSYSRPLEVTGGKYLDKFGINHAGVVATISDGSRWLIHKGAGFGKSSSTVVTDARHMSQKWHKTGEAAVRGKTISDVVKDGLVDKSYSLFGRNCQTASKNIMKNANGRKRRCA